MYFHRYVLVLNEMDEIFSHDQVRVRHSSTAYTRRNVLR